MKYIVSFSGGKDSTAMLLMLLERCYQVDEIVFCDTGKEFPDMYKHIEQVEGYINMPITKLQPEKGFEYWMFEHVKKNGDVGYGWPLFKGARWCTKELKRRPLQKYLKNKYGNEHIEYVGFAFDEPERLKGKKKNQTYPLYDWMITEAEALKYCYDRGFDWNGLYTRFGRVSCYCCPFQSIKDLRNLYYFYPDLWQDIKRMDKKTFNSFKYYYTLEELESKFRGSTN